MKTYRYLYLSLAICALRYWLPTPAQALSITNVTFSDTNITYETGSIPNGTTISFTIDTAGLVQIAVNCGIQNLGDVGTNVAVLSQTYSNASTNQLFWNGLWLISNDLGRTHTTCDFTLTLSTTAGTTSTT